MLGLDTVGALLKQLEAEPIKATVIRCLNRRHKEAHCTLCLVCPTGAIRQGQDIAVDADLCVGCGFCAAQCPTEVFRLDGVTDGDVLRSCRSLAAYGKNQPLEFACKRKPDPGVTRSEAAGVIVLSCLARLSAPLLLAVVAQGAPEVWLDDSLCAACPIGSVHVGIAHAAEAANRTLAIWGRKPAVHTAVGASGPHTPTEGAAAEGLSTVQRRAPVVDPRTPTGSRRDFFEMLRQSASRGLGGLLSGLPAESEMPPAKSRELPHHRPAARRLLNQVAVLLGPPGAGDPAAGSGQAVDMRGLPFADVAIDETCTGCGLCATFCPTGAIEFRSDGKYFTLFFAIQDCVACGLCALGCPSHSVTVSQQFPVQRLTASIPVPSRSGALAPCIQCGTLTTVREGETPQCWVCTEQGRQVHRYTGKQGNRVSE